MTAIPLAPTKVPTVTRRIFQLATLLTFLAVALGSIVCATESGFECGNWPGCTASDLLPSGPVTSFFYQNPWIEMTHRTSAMVVATVALERTPTRLSPSRAGGLAWISVGLMAAMHLVSLFAAGSGSYT